MSWRHLTLVLSCITLVLPACGGAAARASAETSPLETTTPAASETKAETSGTTTESYAGRDVVLHTPSKVTRGAPAPLLIVLHGGLGNATWMHQHLDMDAMADRDGFLVAYLNGSPGDRPRMRNMRTWNGGTCCGPAVKDNADDTGYILGFVQSMIDEHRADPQRIYLMGHSNGGIMSYRLACEHSEVFAAVVVVSGSLGVDSCKPGHVPILQIHGSADDHVPVAGGRGQAAITQNIQFRSVAESAQMLRAAGDTVDVVLVSGGPHDIAGLSEALKAQTSLSLPETAAQFVEGKARTP